MNIGDEFEAPYQVCSATLVGICRCESPTDGNCFSITVDDKEYRILNARMEFLEKTIKERHENGAIPGWGSHKDLETVQLPLTYMGKTRRFEVLAIRPVGMFKDVVTGTFCTSCFSEEIKNPFEDFNKKHGIAVS